MEQEKVTYFLAVYGRYYPEEKIPELIDKIKALQEDCFAKLNNTPKKDPLVILTHSLFLGHFGIDRMMVGEIRKGLLKLLILACMCFLIFFVIESMMIGEICKILLTVITFGFGCIWTIFDWFNIEKLAKEYNYRKILQLL